MNAQDLMIKIAIVRENALEDGYEKAPTLSPMDAYRLARSNVRVGNVLDSLYTSVSVLQVDDIPDFINSLKAIAGDK
jgi:hypothetical protein